MIDQISAITVLSRIVDPLPGLFGPMMPAPEARIVVVTAIGVSLTALLGWSVERMIRRDRKRHGPVRRFVCRELRLTGRQQRRLESIARQAGLPGAVSMLMSRGCFDWAVASASIPRHVALCVSLVLLVPIFPGALREGNRLLPRDPFMLPVGRYSEGVPAVHHHQGPGRIVRLIGEEIEDGTGDIAGLSLPVQRYPGQFGAMFSHGGIGGDED